MPELPPPPSAFHGVRFFLHGFDPEHLHNVRSKLIDGGAVDAVQYDPNCTHVIVDNIVYDDPVCDTARKDGKMVVTSLWADHSFEVGLPVDASSVMYRPLKDLKGIPGAHGLIMCLTGYQRQDRDDIMTMVGLMGAQFSKPLVANKVTHLICYKFEGEKYELAKKIKKIKLVNHRWLEDCLKHWRILPEENYSRSGFELEMEVEAKDSEEETEDHAVKQVIETANVKTVGMVGYSLPCTSAGRPSDILNNKRSAEDVSMVDAQLLTLTPVKKLSSSGATKDLNLLGCQNEGSVKAGSAFVLPEVLGNSVLGDVSHKKLKTTVGSGGVSPSDAKHSSLNYSRKTPIRSPSALFSGVRSGDVNCSLNGKLGEVGDATKGNMDDDIYTTHSRSPLKEIGVPGEVSRNKLLHDKKPEAFCAHTNIQKSSSCVKPCISGNQFNRTEAQEKVANLIDQSFESNTLCAKEKPSIHGLENEPASVPTTASFDLAPSTFLTSRNDCCDNDREAVGQTSCFVTGKQSCGNNPSTGDIVEDKILHHTGELAKEEFLLQPAKIESPGSKGTDAGKSFESGSKNVLGTVNIKVPTGPTRKKSMARKTLGSRTKINTSANRKGSICLSKPASNDGAARIETVCARDENFPMANMVEVSTSHDAFEVLQEAKNTNAMNMEKSTVNEAVSMDDETEPPEEKNVFVCERSIEVEENEVEREKKTAACSEGLNADTCDVTTSKEGTRVNEIGSVDQGKNDEPDESLIPGGKLDHSSAGRNSKAVHSVKNITHNKCGDTEQHKIEKGRSASGNAGTGNSSLASRSSRQMEEKKIVDAGKGDTKKQEKMKNISTTAGKGNNCLKSKSSRKVEEKKAFDEGERAKNVQEKVTCSVSNAKSDVLEPDKRESAVGRSCSESGRKRMKANEEAEKANANSRQVKASGEEAVQPAWFILSGSRPQRKEFQNITRRLKGRCCRDSHQWSYQATHFIAPDPIRRTEKFFAAAASGSWILKSDYLKASSQAGKFLDEKPFEWYQKGLSQDGAINLEAPRKWRLLRENTGHGAFYGMRVMIYGECIAPPLDTLKRVIKAGDGTILATCPPYNKFFNSGVDFVIVSPGMPRVDLWVQEFLKHEIPCVAADYIVEYVCKPGYSLEKHVLYNTQAWAEKSFSRLQRLANELVVSDNDNELRCEICGSADRGEVMLICGDETGSVGCGIGTHIDCCNPPLEAVPEDDWLCPKCSKASEGTVSGGKRKRRPR